MYEYNKNFKNCFKLAKLIHHWPMSDYEFEENKFLKAPENIYLHQNFSLLF